MGVEADQQQAQWVNLKIMTPVSFGVSGRGPRNQDNNSHLTT
jgi:hypothetical protein